jgi:hypothetical protein
MYEMAKSPIITTPDLSDLITTLFINGFNISKVERYSTENSVVNAYKFDILGAEIRYSLLFSFDKAETNLVATLKSISKDFKSKPILINDYIKPPIIQSFTLKEFFNVFGGIVNSGLILIPDLPKIMDALGHNKLPNDIFGDPEDLHEIYVSESLQFALESPTRRYGANRLYEKVPDGLVKCKGGYMLIFDSKAYKSGFEFNSETINSLSFYANDYNERYSQFFGDIFSIVVVSGHFKDSDKSIENRSTELYNLCGKRLTCIESKILGEIVQYLKDTPRVRSSINWKIVLSNTQVKLKHLEKEISRINKDKMY